MTDSGVPDETKPDPDTELSGAILALDVEAGTDLYPIVLTEPGAEFAGLDDLVPGVLEMFATGVRNGFGLTAAGDTLYLTDQGSDGGGVPPPAEGVAGFGPHFGPDHLHLVTAGAYLGQPNLARGERVLNDGSAFDSPVDSTGYVPPIHVFGIHNSATGITEYRGELFPDLQGSLLIGKFSGTAGLQVLHLAGGRVEAVELIAGRPIVGNVTDVAVGPDGQIVVAAFWDLKILIATGWTDEPIDDAGGD
jgi:glucose/arabinose dehydrogenase